MNAQNVSKSLKGLIKRRVNTTLMEIDYSAKLKEVSIKTHPAFKRIVFTGLGMEIEKREDGCNCYIGPIPTHIITRATDVEILAWAKKDEGAIITYWGNYEHN